VESMKNESNNATVEECWKALESCPHDKGTVSVMCRICLGSGVVFAYDLDRGSGCRSTARGVRNGSGRVRRVCPNRVHAWSPSAKKLSRR
jgi:hypothetical protein